ncbi:MAG: hypothetical protein TQ37_03215 [Candidatus Synechococcus spongiarum 15L]|uniref:Uncharacterized protein n=1 Tax=Candidatus Synechococcus spongiarum 15L TaxID=1608419 RepID=A0A0G8AWY3_9SYNE|nr:MAG: hypothetical protein TQ37_03215 [Candidatus Synechococcus spongiarum 15L]
MQVRDDGWLLFGFETDTARELFRELIGVSGVAPSWRSGCWGCWVFLPELVQVDTLQSAPLRIRKLFRRRYQKADH